MHPDDRFPLSSEQCEILMKFETHGSLAQLAQALNRDVSVLSRQISRIAEIAPVFEKQGGRWILTPVGKQLANWVRDSIFAQKRLLQGQHTLRVASPREFASRVLIPNYAELQAELRKAHGEVTLSLVTSDQGVESLLLNGDADLALDCGWPQDPAIKFRRVAREPFVIVASPAFILEHKAKSLTHLLETPHLRYTRLSPIGILHLTAEIPNPILRANDLSVIRSACAEGLGWSILPRYAVAQEIREKRLKELQLKGTPKIDDEQFGLWWLRDRKSLESWIPAWSNWLKSRSL